MDHLTKTSIPDPRTPLWVVQDCPRDSQISTGYMAVALGYPQRRKVNSYWRHPCTSDIGRRGPKLDLTWKSPPLRASSHGSRRCHVSFQWKKATKTLTQLWLLWSGSGTHSLAVTNSSPTGLKTHSTRRKPCLKQKPSQPSKAGKGGVPTTMTFLKQHNH